MSHPVDQPAPMSYSSRMYLNEFIEEINSLVRCGAIQSALINCLQKSRKLRDQAEYLYSGGNDSDAWQRRLQARAIENYQDRIERQYNIRVE